MTADTSDRHPLEMLAAEFLERQRRGERPTIDEYAALHPQLAAEIRELFPTLFAMERLKQRRERSGGEAATLGGVQLERLGDFRIVREIGRGGMGIVYEAVQESLGRRVAVKVLPRQMLLDDKNLRRFRREAETAARLHHPHIVPVFGFGEHEGFHFYVMQLIDGVALDRWSIANAITQMVGDSPTGGATSAPPVESSRPPCGAREIAHIGLQAAEALAYAHSQRVLHRDLKPANLLLDREGKVWVADFGLAKALHGDHVTQQGDLVGTLRYMAPEQFRGESDVRCDVYSLGATLYEILAGRPAYADHDHSQLMRRIMHEEPTPLAQLRGDLPLDLVTIVSKALARDASHRYATSAQLADDLRRFLDDRPIAARPLTLFERSWHWCRRNPAIAALSAAAAVLFLVSCTAVLVGYASTSRALAGEQAERQKADAAKDLALGVLDQIYVEFTPHPLDETRQGGTAREPGAGRPLELSEETAEILERLLVFYDRLATQHPDDVRNLTQGIAANRRMGDIRARLGQVDLAVEAYERALSIAKVLSDSALDAATRAELAMAWNELGVLRRTSSDGARWQLPHERARDLLSPELARGNTDFKLRFELARSHYFLAGQHWGRWPQTPAPLDELFGAGRPPPPESPRNGLPPRRPLGGPGVPGEARPRVQLAAPNLSHADREAALANTAQLLESLVRDYPHSPLYAHFLASCQWNQCRGELATDPQRALVLARAALNNLLAHRVGPGEQRLVSGDVGEIVDFLIAGGSANDDSTTAATATLQRLGRTEFSRLKQDKPSFTNVNEAWLWLASAARLTSEADAPASDALFQAAIKTLSTTRANDANARGDSIACAAAEAAWSRAMHDRGKHDEARALRTQCEQRLRDLQSQLPVSLSPEDLHFFPGDDRGPPGFPPRPEPGPGPRPPRR